MLLMTARILAAKDAELNHCVFVGWGEPTCDPRLSELLDFIHEQGMASSIITNGMAGLDKYKTLYARGLDHIHLSAHGLGDTLDRIMGVPGAFVKQDELTQWLCDTGLPWRSNATIQQGNYKDLPQLAEFGCRRGVKHFVLLNWLPHYEQAVHTREIAVHPAELRPYVEEAADVLLAHNTLFTIRYFPLCHLSPQYWPYVTNAKYVPYDPWEWCQTPQCLDLNIVKQDSERLRTNVACSQPCNQCLAARHCGGWNRTYVAAFDGAGLTPIQAIPDEYADGWEQEGSLFDRNPANQETGTLQNLR
jgi:MoaA/NifB/PqqE/SkfB family radical SAM enzyme